MRKIYFVPSILNLLCFQTDSKIIFYHSDYHFCISGTLTFYMIDLICYFQPGICSLLSVLCLVFVSLLLNCYICGIICAKYLVDQWNHKLWHFLQHCSENIIKYGVICHLIHLSWLLVIVRFCILIMFSDVFLFPGASHL